MHSSHASCVSVFDRFVPVTPECARSAFDATRTRWGVLVMPRLISAWRCHGCLQARACCLSSACNLFLLFLRLIVPAGTEKGVHFVAYSHSSHRDTLIVRPRSVRLVDVRRLFTWSLLWRLFMAFLMCSLYVLGAWSTLTSRAPAAYAASQRQAQLLTSKSPRLGTSLAATSISACPALTGTPQVNGTVDGLGTLGFYTLVKQRLDDRLQLATNVANGNLVVQSSNLQIHGTGIDLAIEATYNSQSSASGVLGANWTLSVGNGVSLSFSGGNATLHGSSGFSATYPADSSSYGGSRTPEGLDATLLNTSFNGAPHVLVFQKTTTGFGFTTSVGENIIPTTNT